jgi:hypothetical protein
MEIRDAIREDRCCQVSSTMLSTCSLTTWVPLAYPRACSAGRESSRPDYGVLLLLYSVHMRLPAGWCCLITAFIHECCFRGVAVWG